MKKIVLLIVVLAGIWIGVTYLKTGQVPLMGTAVSADEMHVRDLRKQISQIDDQMSQAGRTAGMTGMDTTQDVSALLVKKEKLQKELQEAEKKLLH